MSRSQVIALALLTCIPIPLLSLTATIVPLPQILERAAATFVPFLPPTLGEDEGRVARESTAVVRAVEIVGSPVEQRVSSPAATPAGSFARSGPRVRHGPLAPGGNQAGDRDEWIQETPPTSGGGEESEQPTPGADPTSPPADGPARDDPGSGNGGGSSVPSGSGGGTSGDPPGGTSGHGKAGSAPGQGDAGGGQPPDAGGGSSGGSGNGSGGGLPPETGPPADHGTPGAGGRRP